MSTKTDFPPQDFASQVLGELNKDEQVVQAEAVTDIVADYEIQCSTQIGFLKTGTIPQLTLKLGQEKRALTKAKKAVNVAYLDLRGGDFKKYIASITQAEDEVELVNDSISEIEAEIEANNAQVTKFETLLSKLQS